MMDSQPTWNHWICERCWQTTIGKHEDPGTTPFMLGCQATAGCHGTAQSQFYQGDQSDGQVPHVIFFRPKTKLALKDALKRYPFGARREIREHFRLGGCLWKPGPARANQADI